MDWGEGFAHERKIEHCVPFLFIIAREKNANHCKPSTNHPTQPIFPGSGILLGPTAWRGPRGSTETGRGSSATAGARRLQKRWICRMHKKDLKSCETGFVFCLCLDVLDLGGCPVPSCRPMRHCEPLHLPPRGAKQPSPC